jgi:hypothetical protein
MPRLTLAAKDVDAVEVAPADLGVGIRRELVEEAGRLLARSAPRHRPAALDPTRKAKELISAERCEDMVVLTVNAALL